MSPGLRIAGPDGSLAAVLSGGACDFDFDFCGGGADFRRIYMVGGIAPHASMAVPSEQILGLEYSGDYVCIYLPCGCGSLRHICNLGLLRISRISLGRGL